MWEKAPVESISEQDLRQEDHIAQSRWCVLGMQAMEECLTVRLMVVL